MGVKSTVAKSTISSVKKKSSKKWRSKIFRHIINNRIYFFLLIIALLIIPVLIYHSKNSTYFPTKYRFITQLALGMWCSVVASLIFSWAIYLARDTIKKLFIREQINIRVPLMMACAPFYISKQRRIFEKYQLDVELEFKYAGINALSDLNNGDCNFAVASDIAILSYLEKTENHTFEIYVLPFVNIKNHLKILVAPPEGGSATKITTISELAGKKIAYVKDSVHYHFLFETLKNELKKEIPPKTESQLNNALIMMLSEKSTILECFTAVLKKEVAACVLWEPHYLTVQNTFKLEELKNQYEYSWFLCLITTRDFYNKNVALNNEIVKALEEACSFCKNDDEVIKSCHDYMLPEFTGVDSTQLSVILQEGTKHSFRCDKQLSDNLKTKINALYDISAYGKAVNEMAKHSIWPL